MTWRKREIMDMARESWLDVYGLGHDRNSFVKALQDFEKLVREDEREACAKVCEEFNFGQAPMMIQRAIRARGQA
jgi:hypothetical protein